MLRQEIEIILDEDRKIGCHYRSINRSLSAWCEQECDAVGYMTHVAYTVNALDQVRRLIKLTQTVPFVISLVLRIITLSNYIVCAS
jgi:hypothetical protein